MKTETGFRVRGSGVGQKQERVQDPGFRIREGTDKVSSIGVVKAGGRLWRSPSLPPAPRTLLPLLFLCLGLSLQTLALDVTVRPDKLRVKPGETVKLDVGVNGLPAGQTAEIACRVTGGLDEETANFTGKTDAEGKAQFSFCPKKEWSYGVSVTAKAGADSAKASDVFTCAVNPYAVAVDYGVPEVYGPDVLPDGSAAPEGPTQSPYRLKEIAAQVAKFRDFYLAVGELMGPAYCSFSSIKPPVPNYFKGFHYNYSTNAVRQVISDLHKNGISSVMYVNTCLTGIAGLEFARKHPEYLAYQADGSPYTGGIYTKSMAVHQWYIANYPESLKQVSAMQSRNPQPEDVKYGGGLASLASDYPGFVNAWLDCEDPRVAEIGAEKIIEGQEYFGYDGVRYDGEYRVPSIGDPLAPSFDLRNWKGEKQKVGKEAEELTVRNMRRAIGLMRKKNPEFLIGLNNADYRSDAMGDRAIASEYGKTISPGTWILDEVAKDSNYPASSTHLWKDFIRDMSAEADRTRRAGNFLFGGWGGGPGQKVVDTKLIKAISWASGLRWICGGGQRDSNVQNATHIYNGFCLRYCEFILNNKLGRLPADKAKALIKVDGKKPVLWENFAQTLQIDGRNYLIIHLINQPLENGIVVEAQEPPAIDNITVTIDNAIFGKGKPDAGAARLLSPDLAAESQKLSMKEDGNKTVLLIPELKIWDVVVIPY